MKEKEPYDILDRIWYAIEPLLIRFWRFMSPFLLRFWNFTAPLRDFICEQFSSFRCYFSDFINSSDVQDSIKISKFVVGKILIVLFWIYTGILFLVFWGAAIQDWHWFLGLVLGWLPAFIGIFLMSFVLWLSIIFLGINFLIFIFSTDMNFAQVFLGPIGLNFRAAYFLIGLYT